jgi:hypothetical protein
MCLLVTVFLGVRVSAFSDARDDFEAVWTSRCPDGLNYYDARQEHDAHFEYECSCIDGSCIDYLYDWCSDGAALSYDYCSQYYCGVDGLLSGCWTNYENRMLSDTGCLYCET